MALRLAGIGLSRGQKSGSLTSDQGFQRRSGGSIPGQRDQAFRDRDRRFRPSPEIGHLRAERAVTFGRNGRSRSSGISGQVGPENALSGVVRDAKHPRAKKGNHRRFKFTLEAWEIVRRQSRNSQYIFPYNAKSVGEAFARACRVLGITDLRFHDLRHEATSQLFERGYEIHEVAQFTLHESWNELKRYTHLQPQHVRELPRSAATRLAVSVDPVPIMSDSKPKTVPENAP
jgi:hypothetical protein